MKLGLRLFRRAECRTDVAARCDSNDTRHAEVKRIQHEYTKRPTVAAHVFKDNDGGYSRNARRLDDEKKYLIKRRRVLYLSPVLVFIAAASFMLWGPFTNRPQVLSAQQTTGIAEDAQPTVVPLAGSADETPAGNYIDAYRVAPNRPRVVTISSLTVKARVLEVGIDGRGQPQLARNSYDVGWYNVGALPGKAGAVVLSGACSGSVGQGVFRRLSELQHGSTVSIERGDGVRLDYQVERVETVPVDGLNMAEVLSPTNRSDEGLNLIGCAGSYDVKTNDFADRVVVYTVRI